MMVRFRSAVIEGEDQHCKASCFVLVVSGYLESLISGGSEVLCVDEE